MLNCCQDMIDDYNKDIKMISDRIAGLKIELENTDDFNEIYEINLRMLHLRRIKESSLYAVYLMEKGGI